MKTLEKFLQRNNVVGSTTLPLVHSTQAAILKHLMTSNVIVPTYCDVFGSELSYFFVGRPGYKKAIEDKEIGYWQLPACFIFEFDAVPDLMAAYPFDTGAHDRRRMPSFIQMFDKAEYELPGNAANVSRIIGALFSTPLDYYKLQPKPITAFSAEFALGVFDEEVQALHMLACTSNSEDLDDRRLCVEVQTKSAVPLNKRGLLAVVCPSVYLDNADFRKHVETVWQAEPISYNVYPLSYDNYVSTIYDKVFEFYKSRGIL